ncbi:endo-1,3;1,4-beta-D-glucanase-like isoform X2 [Papaver somniferum]|uniref:endo-1,3;1,4-beta-D-glucanase-like isoform X2 n=1 Tax=Papaver somniferum TaxID=3469 RepID=UPI000E6F8D57|nr:endo-1,3;1,4-beta-D-glucanase-like isoform X2 [Papaver somniferum]
MVGSQCCENPPDLSLSSGIGCVEDIGGLESYITGSLDSKLGILLVSDVYGFEAPNLRKLADKVAAAGYYVVAPNFFHGDPFTPEKNLMYWYQFHLAEDAAEEARPVIEALRRSKGITAIGAAAKVLVELSKLDDLKAIVMLHPSLVTVDDIEEIKVPISILGAEVDHISPPELVKEFEEVLSTKAEVDSFVKIFNGVRHGWTVRYNIKNVEAVKRAEEAHNDMLEWFFKYVRSSCFSRQSAL